MRPRRQHLNRALLRVIQAAGEIADAPSKDPRRAEAQDHLLRHLEALARELATLVEVEAAASEDGAPSPRKRMRVESGESS